VIKVFKLPIAVLLVIAILTILVLPQNVQAAWWDTEFQYRRQLSVEEAPEGYTD
jgi:hypothetical protein